MKYIKTMIIFLSALLMQFSSFADYKAKIILFNDNTSIIIGDRSGSGNGGGPGNGSGNSGESGGGTGGSGENGGGNGSGGDGNGDGSGDGDGNDDGLPNDDDDDDENDGGNGDEPPSLEDIVINYPNAAFQNQQVTINAVLPDDNSITYRIASESNDSGISSYNPRPFSGNLTFNLTAGTGTFTYWLQALKDESVIFEKSFQISVFRQPSLDFEIVGGYSMVAGIPMQRYTINVINSNNTPNLTWEINSVYKSFSSGTPGYVSNVTGNSFDFIPTETGMINIEWTAYATLNGETRSRNGSIMIVIKNN